MSRMLNKPWVAVVGGLLFTTPFIVLEWVNTPDFWSIGISPLFFFMWLVSTIFTFILWEVLLDLNDKKKAKTNLIVVAKFAIIILMAWIFVGLVIDQWPCFMGIPNCD